MWLFFQPGGIHDDKSGICSVLAISALNVISAVRANSKLVSEKPSNDSSTPPVYSFRVLQKQQIRAIRDKVWYQFPAFIAFSLAFHKSGKARE